jgi:choice-of-anchor C domain-containing protein
VLLILDHSAIKTIANHNARSEERRMNRIFGILLVAGLPLYSQASVNLIIDGDFESPVVTDQAAGFDTYQNGQTFTGWVVGGQSIDLVADDPKDWVSWTAFSGHQSIDLNGMGPGSISQDIHTVPGQTYALGFALAANPVNAPPVVQVDFYWQNQLVDTLSVEPNRNRSDPGWTYHEYTVSAQTDLVRLTFEGVDRGGTAGALIDDVILRPTGNLRRLQSLPESTGHLVEMAVLLPLALDGARRLKGLPRP